MLSPLFCITTTTPSRPQTVLTCCLPCSVSPTSRSPRATSDGRSTLPTLLSFPRLAAVTLASCFPRRLSLCDVFAGCCYCLDLLQRPHAFWRSASQMRWWNCSRLLGGTAAALAVGCPSHRGLGYRGTLRGDRQTQTDDTEGWGTGVR